MTMASKYEILLSPKFKREYEKQYEWSVGRHGQVQTDDFFNQLDKKINNLKQDPKLFAERAGTGYRLMPIKSAVVLYKVDDRNKQVKLASLVKGERMKQIYQERGRELKREKKGRELGRSR